MTLVDREEIDEMEEDFYLKWWNSDMWAELVDQVIH